MTPGPMPEKYPLQAHLMTHIPSRQCVKCEGAGEWQDAVGGRWFLCLCVQVGVVAANQAHGTIRAMIDQYKRAKAR